MRIGGLHALAKQPPQHIRHYFQKSPCRKVLTVSCCLDEIVMRYLASWQAISYAYDSGFQNSGFQSFHAEGSYSRVMMICCWLQESHLRRVQVVLVKRLSVPPIRPGRSLCLIFLTCLSFVQPHRRQRGASTRTTGCSLLGVPAGRPARDFVSVGLDFDLTMIDSFRQLAKMI